MYILWMWSSGMLWYNLYSWEVSQCLFCTTKTFICVRISIIVASCFLKVYRMYMLVIVLYWILTKSLKIIWSLSVHAVGFSTRWQNGVWYNITSWLLNWFPLVRASVCVCVSVCVSALRTLITGGVIWCNIPYSGLFFKQKFLQKRQNLNFKELKFWRL